MDDATTVSNDAIFKMVESFREMQPHGDYLLGDIDDRLEAVSKAYYLIVFFQPFLS